MKANIAYKFELMPTREQTRIFAQAHRVPAFCLGVSGFLCLGRLFQGQPNEAALCI